MPLYRFVAADRRGKKIRSELIAENPRAAREILRESALVPRSLIEVKGRGRRRLGPTETALLSRQVGVLLKAGFPLSRALEAVAGASKDGPMKALLAFLDERVRSGRSLSAAMRESEAFGPEVVEMVRGAEAGGDLGGIMLRLAELFEKRIETRRKITSSLLYPVIVTTIAVLVVIFVFTYILPTISRLFEAGRMPLPLPTRILMGVSLIAEKSFLPLLVVGLVSAPLIYRWSRSNRGRAAIERLLLRLPGLGDILLKGAVSRWARMFSALLGGGVDIMDAVSIAAGASGSPLIITGTKRILSRLADGESLSSAMTASGAFPPLAVEMTAVGEEAGSLPELMNELASAWESEVEARADRFAVILEPVVLVIMGLVVGAIVLSVLLPIFEFNQSVH